MRNFESIVREHQSEVTSIVTQKMQEKELTRREILFTSVLENVHPIAGRLHPNVVCWVNREPNDPVYDQHQLLKFDDKSYQQKTPVLVQAFDDSHDIVVEIDRWASERDKDWLHLSSYGVSQLMELFGPDAFRDCFINHLCGPLTFFGKHVFDRHYADAAIRLANFAATRDQNPDFQYWFISDRQETKPVNSSEMSLMDFLRSVTKEKTSEGMEVSRNVPELKDISNSPNGSD